MATSFAPTLFAAVLLVPCAVWARDFRLAEVEGILDLSIGYGALVRLEERDRDLIGIANGGSAHSVNFDDGDLNYGRGVARNMVKASADLGIAWRNFGAFARAIGYYDFETELEDRARTALIPDGKDIEGSEIEAREYYLTGRFHPFGVPLQVRVGNQTLNWGESNFLRFGIDVMNPVDLVSIAQPTRSERDLFLPRGTIWAAANLTERFAIEGFYQYDWNETPLAATGAFLSTSDAYGGDGTRFTVLGEGLVSDLGTDLDAEFALPSGTLGFDPNYLHVPGAGRETPSDQGQWGLTIQGLLMDLNASRVGLHFVNYHSPFAVLNGTTAGAAAVAQTSQAAIDAEAAQLVPIYEAGGLSPVEAQAAADRAATQLALSTLANATRYFMSFPENIKMVGVTFNTATVRRGTLIAGEVSHHFDFPFQILPSDVLRAALSPFLADPSFGRGPLGAFGPDQTVRGFTRRDKTQLALNLSQLFGARWGASQSLLSLDFGWIHVHDMPSRGDLPLAAPGITGPGDRSRLPTASSMGYRVLAQLRYTSVLGGLNLSPRVFLTHDFHGVTPGPFSAFIEDRIGINLGVGLDYINRWTADLSYTNFTGAGRFNLLRDRDAFRFNITYYY